MPRYSKEILDTEIRVDRTRLPEFTKFTNKVQRKTFSKLEFMNPELQQHGPAQYRWRDVELWTAERQTYSRREAEVHAAEIDWVRGRDIYNIMRRDSVLLGRQFTLADLLAIDNMSSEFLAGIYSRHYLMEGFAWRSLLRHREEPERLYVPAIFLRDEGKFFVGCVRINEVFYCETPALCYRNSPVTASQ